MAPSPMTAMTLLRAARRGRARRPCRGRPRSRSRNGRRRRDRIRSRRAGEAGQPAFLAQRADAVAAAGQDLVRIGLVADIPDQPVVRRVEDIVEGDRQFDHAEAGAEMAAGVRDGVDQFGAQFGGQLRQVAFGKRFADRQECGPCREAAFAGVASSRDSGLSVSVDMPRFGDRVRCRTVNVTCKMRA